MRRCQGSLLVAVSALTFVLGGGTSSASLSKPVWEHSVDVHRFFRNHPVPAASVTGRRVLRRNARQAYSALIGKWGGVHRCEGAWDDAGDPYWGGLQMDRSFMATYGGEFVVWWGLADAWPAWAQMTAAERAYRSGRGGGPWPVCQRYLWS